MRFHTQINSSGYPALSGKRGGGGLNYEGDSIRDCYKVRLKMPVKNIIFSINPTSLGVDW